MGKRRRLPYLCRNHGPPDSGDLASAEDFPHSFHSTAAHAQEAIVQETGGIGITGDELDLFAHLETGMAARHLEDAVLSRKIAQAQFGMVDGQGEWWREDMVLNPASTTTCPVWRLVTVVRIVRAGRKSSIKKRSR